MRLGFIYSIVLHVAILSFLFLGLPNFARKLPVEESSIVLDIVPLSAVTNLKLNNNSKPLNEVKSKVVKEQSDNEGKKLDTKKNDEVKPKVKNTAQPNKKDNKEPNKNSEVAKDQPKDKKENTKTSNDDKKSQSDNKSVVLKNEELKEPKDTVPVSDDLKNKNLKKEEKKENKPQEKATKNQANTKIKKEQKEDLWDKSIEEIINNKSILKSLEQNNKADKKQQKKNDSEATLEEKIDDIEEIIRGESNKEYNENLPLSLSEMEAIRSQLEQAWNTSSFGGGNNNKNMNVKVLITLDREGNVLSAKPELSSLQLGNPVYNAFVDSAVRAVYIASPLKHLPIDKYDTWKEFEFNFDASQMID